MTSFFSRIIANYKTGDGFTKLLYINLAFFIIYTIINAPQSAANKQREITQISCFINNYLAFPSQTNILLQRPWTFLSYMFIHKDLFHILSNMIFLYFGSKLFLQHFGSKQLISLYILGGICGAILFKVVFNSFPEVFEVKDPLFGASAGVISIIVAISTYKPNLKINLLFLGKIKLKHICWFAIVLFYIGIGEYNPGGNIAHLGGAIFGYLYIKQLQKGNVLSKGFSNFLSILANTFKNKSKLKTVHQKSKSDYEFNKNRANKQKEIDIILEKIAKSGYESLSKSEKSTLFSASKK